MTDYCDLFLCRTVMCVPLTKCDKWNVKIPKKNCREQLFFYI